MMYDSYIMKRTQIYLDLDQDERLAQRARSAGTTKSTLIRDAIEEYLAKPDEDARLASLRIVLDELGLIPLGLVDGAAYVETVRGADTARRDDFDARRTRH
jgi:predicted DNA-binding protein